MLFVSLLDEHESSTLRILKDINSLAQRKDLYTGDDFYFGFDSSNDNSVKIIRDRQPLAIKHGPIFSIFVNDADGCRYDAYYIDVKTKALLPVLSITAQTTAAEFVAQLLPWSFVDFYLQARIPDTIEPVPETITPEQASQKSELTPEKLIYNLIELLATNYWPDDAVLNLLPSAVTKLNVGRKDIAITLADMADLKQKMLSVAKNTGANDFIAPYNPFFDNLRISIDFLEQSNPKQITVRKINDKYPRIEIIAPGLPQGKHYQAVYESVSSELYNNLVLSLDNPQEVAELLSRNFPEIMKAYSAT
jgi:hypothetical protein